MVHNHLVQADGISWHLLVLARCDFPLTYLGHWVELGVQEKRNTEVSMWERGARAKVSKATKAYTGQKAIVPTASAKSIS